MRTPSLPVRTLAITALVALAWPLAAGAGPVSGDALAADPYELALNWTLASLSTPAARPGAVEAPAAQAYAPVPAVAPPLAVPSGGVPDPGAYALMGLLLLGAGLLGRHWAGRQRGLSKKT